MTARLPLPPHFDPGTVGRLWRVPYDRRAEEALRWAADHGVRPSDEDRRRVGLLAIDVQNTFCLPDFELYVGGRSGHAAVDDCRRLCEFLYRNLGAITHCIATLDTHEAMQIFHPVFLVDGAGRHPAPYTSVTHDDVVSGRWRFNPALAPGIGLTVEEGERYLRRYTAALEAGGKYALTVWPYHAMQGGVGQALVPAFEEALFFHGTARSSRPVLRPKGDDPLTEHYSALGPEVRPQREPAGRGARDDDLVERLLGFDALVVAGQAKSHCVAWTVIDLLAAIRARDADLADRVYLLEDCTSPVVVAGGPDFSAAADEAFARFAEAGMHRVCSTDPPESWPGPMASALPSS